MREPTEPDEVGDIDDHPEATHLCAWKEPDHQCDQPTPEDPGDQLVGEGSTKGVEADSGEGLHLRSVEDPSMRADPGEARCPDDAGDEDDRTEAQDSEEPRAEP